MGAVRNAITGQRPSITREWGDGGIDPREHLIADTRMSAQELLYWTTCTCGKMVAVAVYEVPSHLSADVFGDLCAAALAEKYDNHIKDARTT